LINLGVDVNTPSVGTRRNTALCEAAKTRNVRLVQVLLKVGADPNAETFSTTPLHEAMFGTINTELVKILLEAGTDTNRVSAYMSPLLSAAQKNDSKLVQMLLAAGAEVNMFPPEYKTALQVAAEWGSLELVSILLDAGADVDALDGQEIGYPSPIEYATAGDDTEMVELLLQWEAKVDGSLFCDEDVKDTDPGWDILRYRTPLQLAVSHGNAEMVRLLLGAGAKADGHGQGTRPLQIAAETGNDHLVKLLLDMEPKSMLAPGHLGKEPLFKQQQRLVIAISSISS
jgi:ankyrin repeat protein